VAQLAAEEHGVLSLRELRGCGLDDDAVGVRTRRAGLHRVHHGVYAVGHPGLTREGRFLAAVKACGEGAALSHFSAAAHYGLLDWEERHPEVTVATSRPRRHPGVRVHRTVKLHPADARSHGGIPCTSPARTIADLASYLSYNALRRAVRQGQSMGLVGLKDLLRTMNRLGPRRGCRRLRRVLAEGHVPARSVLEDMVLDLIMAGGFEKPEVNRPLWIDGRRLIPDFRWPAQRIIVEADSRRWHDNPTARGHDAERQALLEARGERVLRVTWVQAVSKQAETVRRLSAAGAPPAGGQGSR
jgi:very-short-patch-repair endonuclease